MRILLIFRKKNINTSKNKKINNSKSNQVNSTTATKEYNNYNYNYKNNYNNNFADINNNIEKQIKYNDNLEELRNTKGKSKNNFFKALGFDYKYISKGNDVKTLIEVLEEL